MSEEIKVSTDDMVIDTVDEMRFAVTMCDGSKKLLRFILKDAKVKHDETRLEFNRDTYRRSDLPAAIDTERAAVLSFNWTAFNLEILDLEEGFYEARG